MQLLEGSNVTNRIMPLGGNIEIAGVEIHMDAEGRFSLNDFHRAAGAESRHQPALFLRRPETEELVEAISNSAPAQNKPVESKPGRYGGTYVCKELVYAYATWISPVFHLKVIRTFDGIATGQSQPQNLGGIRDAVQLFGPFFEVATLIGCDQQAAAISANQAVLAVSGANVLQLMGRTHLEASNQDALYFTPTELGKRIGTSARGMNLLLAEAGFQMKRGEHWEVTDAGRDFARVYDTGKKHGSGVPIQQIKWSPEVIPAIGKDAA
ncbi:KilA-N domain-containing protein [Paraburkholderia tropica]|uniref:KilA-N domain-containing protein n=1 Tax=Paraburkholderia tropica TaxID=92647 RepID=UPI003D2BDEF0